MVTRSPLITVGITTFRRPELLREAVQSVIKQSYSNIEILIGNDDQSTPVTRESLGIDDPRIRILNYPKNLREIGNMNALLESAQGDYFTLMADDDSCDPKFLEAAVQAIEMREGTQVVFTGFSIFNDLAPKPVLDIESPRWLRGDDFAAGALSKKIPALGLCGVYKIDFLRKIGGFEPLVSEAKIGLYAEYLLLAKVFQLSEVAYVASPLVYYRQHENSWGVSNKEVSLYRSSISVFLKRVCSVLSDGGSKNRRTILKAMIRMSLGNFYGKAQLSEGLSGFGSYSLYQETSKALNPELGLNSFILFQVAFFRIKAALRASLPSSLWSALKKLKN